MTFGIALAAVLSVVLLFVSGFTSGSEIAFFSLSPSDPPVSMSFGRFRVLTAGRWIRQDG